VGNILTLTPLDTSFGSLPPNASATTGIDDNSKDAVHHAAAATLSSSPGFKGNGGGGGDSSNVIGGGGCAYVPGGPRTNPSPKHQHPRVDKGATEVNARNAPGTDDPNEDAHDDEGPSPPPPMAAAAVKNDHGISTFTAFKRPNVKVGLVFTRKSAQHPDVAVISRIMPESIFRRHHLPSPGGGEEAAQRSRGPRSSP
jgi:hypothetical protein